MKGFKKTVWTLMAMAVLVACGGKKQQAQQQEENVSDAPKYLVLYYSQTEATKMVAEELQMNLEADIESIVLEVPYDGDYDQTLERSKQEREEGVVPALEPLQVNLEDYDVIFLGYPVWYGTYASPIAGLLENYDFAGKKIVPFCTFGSGGLEASVEALRQALPDAEVADGFGIRKERVAAAPKEVNRFLVENGYIEGELEELPDYSEQQPVTEEEIAIFEAACGDYKFPLGTPVTVGQRSTADGTDYCYTVENTDPEGVVTTATIYVTVGVEEDAQPEFTRVVR